MVDSEEISERLVRFEAEIADLKSRVARLESEKSALSRALEFENLPPDTVVGKDYVAWRFGCSIRAILNKEAGTGAIKRFSLSPLKFVKRDVDAEFRKRRARSKSPAEKAADARAKAKPRRLRSIITKRPA